jgi:hypothetical protein
MGLAVAAVVLSLTLGVLIGLVIHTGMQQRADRHPGPSTRTVPAGSTGSDSDAGSEPGGDDGGPWDASPGPGDGDPGGVSDGTDGAGVMPTGGAVGTGDPTPTSTRTVTVMPSRTSTAGVSAAARSATATSTSARRTPATTSSTLPTIVRTTVSGTATATTGTASGSTGTATRTSGTSSTAASAHPGTDSPGGRCSTLGQKSSTASGATLYCQHDQQDGTLRWRAVTDGGGCLNRTMTGIGLDGHRYACRVGAGGLNHWVRVG